MSQIHPNNLPMNQYLLVRRALAPPHTRPPPTGPILGYHSYHGAGTATAALATKAVHCTALSNSHEYFTVNQRRLRRRRRRFYYGKCFAVVKADSAFAAAAAAAKIIAAVSA